MDQYLYKYVILHKNLSIPQLGSFHTRYDAAHVETATGLLHAPKQTIHFSDGEITLSDKLFFDFLSSEMGVDEVTAIKEFHEYSYALRNELVEKKETAIKGLGTLKKNQDDVLVFYPAHDASELSPSLSFKSDGKFAVTNETYTEEYETEEKPDRWWIYALLLAAAGAAALCLYYYYY